MSAIIMPERKGGRLIFESPNFVKLTYQDLQRIQNVMENEMVGEDGVTTLDAAEQRTLAKVGLIMKKMEEKKARGDAA